MKFHFDTKRDNTPVYGVVKAINHPMVNKATIFEIENKGICVIQQKFNAATKSTSWGPIGAALANDIYTHPKFKEYFDEFAAEKNESGFYPIVNVRSIMWSLRMKPLVKEPWEEWKGDLWTKKN